MSYQHLSHGCFLLLDLDEYDESKLLAELERRKKLRDEDKCDYCGRDVDPPCRFPTRHAHAVAARLRKLRAEDPDENRGIAR